MELKTRMQGFFLAKSTANGDDKIAKTDQSTEKPADIFAPLLLKILVVG